MKRCSKSVVVQRGQGAQAVAGWRSGRAPERAPSRPKRLRKQQNLKTYQSPPHLGTAESPRIYKNPTFIL